MIYQHDIFAPLRAELDLWHDQGRQALLWFRDDDAAEHTTALEQLVAVTGRYDVPLLLCVVPETTGGSLSQWLNGQAHVRVSVHGFGHHNHAPAGEKSQELGPHRPTDTVCKELIAARSRLHSLYEDQLSDILVPPWNRIAPAVVQKLPEIGFAGLSTFGTASEADGTEGLKQLNTHLDIIDWKGSRGGRDPAWLIGELVQLLALAREGDGNPIGILAHHLVHDDIAWDFIERLFVVTCNHPVIRWCVADDLI